MVNPQKQETFGISALKSNGNVIISSVYSPFSNEIGLPLYNIPSSGVNEEYWSKFLTIGCPSWRQPHAWDAVSNSSKYGILSEISNNTVVQICVHNSYTKQQHSFML